MVHQHHCSSNSLHTTRVINKATMPEDQPLLNENIDATLPTIDSNGNTKQSSASRYLQEVRKRCYKLISDRTNRLVACAFLVYLLSEFGMLTLQIPCARLFERAVCRTYYNKHSDQHFLGMRKEIDEHLCKIHPIQVEVATLAGWRDSFLAIPSM
jgi:hypothetical protein